MRCRADTERIESAHRCTGVDLEPTAEERGFVQPAEREMSVRDRCGTARPVRGGPGIGACGLRADPERPAFVDPGNGSSPSADGVDIDRGQADRQVRDRPFVGERNPAGTQTHVCRGSADVQGDDVVEPETARLGERAGHAGCGAGEKRACSQVAGLRGAQGASVRLDDRKRLAACPA